MTADALLAKWEAETAKLNAYFEEIEAMEPGYSKDNAWSRWYEMVGRCAMLNELANEQLKAEWKQVQA